MSSKNLRLLLAGVVALLVLGGIVWLVWYYQSTGEIQVTTDNNKATIALISPLSTRSELSKSGTATTRVSPGSYTIVAKSGESETRSTLTIEKQQTIKVRLGFEQVKPARSVISANAKSVQGQGGAVRYINAPVNTLYVYTVGNVNPVAYPDKTSLQLGPVESVAWLSSNHGLVKNTLGGYFILDGPNVTQLSQQSLANQNSPQTVVGQVAANAANHLASSIGNDVLYQGSPNDQLKKIATLSAGSPGVNISSQDQVVYYLRSGLESAQNSDFRLHIVSATNLQTPEQIVENDEAIKSTHWSPEGKKLIISTGNGLYWYDTVTKQKKTILPTNSSLSTFTDWIDDNQLLYVDSQTIWNYNVDTGIAHKLVGFAESESLFQSLSVALDKKSLFYSISPSAQLGVVGGVFTAPL